LGSLLKTRRLEKEVYHGKGTGGSFPCRDVKGAWGGGRGLSDPRNALKEKRKKEREGFMFCQGGEKLKIYPPNTPFGEKKRREKPLIKAKKKRGKWYSFLGGRKISQQQKEIYEKEATFKEEMGPSFPARHKSSP